MVFKLEPRFLSFLLAAFSFPPNNLDFLSWTVHILTFPKREIWMSWLSRLHCLSGSSSSDPSCWKVFSSYLPSTVIALSSWARLIFWYSWSSSHTALAFLVRLIGYLCLRLFPKSWSHFQTASVLPWAPELLCLEKTILNHSLPSHVVHRLRQSQIGRDPTMQWGPRYPPEAGLSLW